LHVWSDSVRSQPTWLYDSPLDQDLEIIPLAETPSMVEDTSTNSTDIKTQLAQLCAIQPNSRERLPSMRRVQTPVCLQNPFLEEDANLLQKLTAQGKV